MPAPRRRDLFEWLRPPTKTEEGYWVGEGIVARSGVMPYVELDDSGRKVEFSEYVPQSTILGSLPNLENKPIVIRHPEGDEDVGPSNYKYLSVGHVGRIRFMPDPQEPTTLLAIAEVYIMDARGIRVVENGTFCELSPGYDAATVEEHGMCPLGYPYQYKQTSRRHNHLALVEDARGGERMTLRRDSAQMMVKRRDNGNYNGQQPQPQQQPRQDSSIIDYNQLGQAVVQAMIAAGFAPQQRQDNMPQRQDNQQPMPQPQRQDNMPQRQDMMHQDGMPQRMDMAPQRQDMMPQRQDMQDPAQRRDAMDAMVAERVALLEEGKALGVQLDPTMDANAIRRAIVSHQRPHTRRDAADAEILMTYKLLKEDAQAQTHPRRDNAQQPGGWGNQNTFTPTTQTRRDGAEDDWQPHVR